MCVCVLHSLRCALYIPTIRLKTKDQPTHTHTRKHPKKTFFIWFYLQFTNMYCSVCWVILRWWLLFSCVCMCILWTIWCTFFSYKCCLCEQCSLWECFLCSFLFWGQLKFKSNWLRIVGISLLFISLYIFFLLLILFACLTQRVWRWKCSIYKFGQSKDYHSEIYFRWTRQLLGSGIFFLLLLSVFWVCISNCWIVSAIKWNGI